MLKRHKLILLIVKYLKFLRYRYIRCDSIWIYGNLLDSTVRKVYINNTFEDDALFDRIAFFLSEDSTYLDVGANYGFYFTGILNLTIKKNIRIHLIEPNKDCFFCLKKTINQNLIENVFLHGVALDHENGQGTFRYDQNSSVTGSLNYKFINFQRKSSFSKSLNNYVVPKLTLDEWMNKNSIDEVQVMKLDTSGYDWNIYCGGQKTFKSGLIKVIFFDLLKDQLLLHGTKVSQIIKFLLDNDYHLYHSIGQKNEKKHIFNIGNQNRSYLPMDVKKMLKRENCEKSYKHVHGMAVHSSYLNDIKVTKYA